MMPSYSTLGIIAQVKMTRGRTHILRSRSGLKSPQRSSSAVDIVHPVCWPGYKANSSQQMKLHPLCTGATRGPPRKEKQRGTSRGVRVYIWLDKTRANPGVRESSLLADPNRTHQARLGPDSLIQFACSKRTQR